MQIKKLWITDRFGVKKKSWEFRVPTVYVFVVIPSQNLLFWD